jgi:hypothetical protein
MVSIKELSPEWLEGHCVRDWYHYFGNTEIQETEFECIADVFIAHHRKYIDIFEERV